MTIGERLNEEIEKLIKSGKLGVKNLKDFAPIVGVSVRTIANWHERKKPANIEFAGFLGCFRTEMN